MFNDNWWIFSKAFSLVLVSLASLKYAAIYFSSALATNSLTLLHESYKNLKYRLGRIPTIKDFDENEPNIVVNNNTTVRETEEGINDNFQYNSTSLNSLKDLNKKEDKNP